MTEQKFYYIAAQRSDGRQPGMEKAVHEAFFLDRGEAETLMARVALRYRLLSGRENVFAVFEATASWPDKPDALNGEEKI